MEKTAVTASTRQVPEPQRGTVVSETGEWRFEYDPEQAPKVSSGRKEIYEGIFVDPARRLTRSARALVFAPDSMGAFGRECANLGRLSSIGVGPQVFAITTARLGDAASPKATIIEEDAGVLLAELLEHPDTPVPGAPAAPLHAPGTHERTIENAKITFDIISQVINAHSANLYHRDLRCENVCVRRFGSAPQDIKATVIDFELGTDYAGGQPRERAALYQTLFGSIPTELASFPLAIRPNPLELDLGYLAALEFQLSTGSLALSRQEVQPETMQRFLAFLDGHIAYFGYTSSVTPLAIRRPSPEAELAPLAAQAGLTAVDARNFGSEQLRANARSFHRAYLDREELQTLGQTPAAKLEDAVEMLMRAKFETYKQRRRAQGKPVEYERIEDQPEALQRSNRKQAEHILTKVETLGYVIVALADADPKTRVKRFSDDQIEFLARLEHARWVEERLESGYTLGPERDHVRKTSPYLIPYDELDEPTKDYDRDAARAVIPLLEQAGLAVTRQE